MRMAKHGRKDLRIESVPQARDKSEEEEEGEVEDEENDGDDLEPVSIVRKLMEQDRYDSSAHCDDEPAVPDRSYQLTANMLLNRGERTRE